MLLVLFPLLIMLVATGKKIHAIRLQRKVARAGNFLFGIRMVKIGTTVPDWSKQAIYVSNHNSNLDPFISGALVESDFKFIGKAEVLKMPVFGYVLRHLNVPVRREDPDDRARSMADLAQALREGFSLIIYSEGTRNKGGELVGPFHEGAFRLSLEYGYPVILLAAINSDKRIPPNRWLLNPGRLYYRWSEPLNPLPGETKETYALRAREVLIGILQEERTKLGI